jgi:acetyl-CoA carboxylase carboxyl transferase subunit beta
MAWFKKSRKPIEAQPDKSSKIPEGLWVKCPDCSQAIYNKDLAQNLQVCPKCGHHFRLSALERLRHLFDDGVFEEHDPGLSSTDPLEFVDTKPYRARLSGSRKATGHEDAVVCATGRIDGIPADVAAMEYGFIGGSMGVVVGEKITRAIERAIAARRPVIVVSCSGGARMMEGALSLMQMTASFAMLGDLNIAEPKALIGFAGPRVIEQTIRQKLPAGFQRSEFLLEHGFVDLVVDRRELKSTLTRVLRFMLADAPSAAPATAPVAAAAETPE